LIIKDALAGNLNRHGEPSSITRMFVNISPSIFDTEVTNRSFKFAYKTGRIKTKKVDHAVLKIQKARTLEREERFEKNNLKLLKCSPVKEDAKY